MNNQKVINKNYLLFGVLLFSLFSFSLVSATLNVTLSDQGTGVSYSNGTLLSSGDLKVLVLVGFGKHTKPQTADTLR